MENLLSFQSPSVVGMCAYRDVSGLFGPPNSGDKVGGGAYGGYMKPEPHMKIEDEEDLLYGESGNAFKVTSVSSFFLFQSFIFIILPNYAHRLWTWPFRHRIKTPIGGVDFCNPSNQRIGYLSPVTMVIWRFSLCPT